MFYTLYTGEVVNLAAIEHTWVALLESESFLGQ